MSQTLRTPNDERDALRDMTERLLEDWAATGVRPFLEVPDDRDDALWGAFADLGLAGILVPEHNGGSGGSFADGLAVAEAVGRHLAFVPFTASALLATSALLLAGDEPQQRAWLPGMTGGQLTGTVSLCGTNGGVGADRIGFTARLDGHDVVVHGQADFVADAAAADLLVIACRVADRTTGEASDVTLVVAEAGVPGLTVTSASTFDLTRRFATVTADEVRVPASAILGPHGGAGAAYTRLLGRAAAATAADSLGGAQHLLAVTVHHATQRIQFGRPVGSFQAVKHLCADMAIQVECSRAALDLAAEAVDDPTATSIAKAYIAEAAARVAGDAIQIHGGIGFTWEHDAHLYLRRAKANQALFGNTHWHRDRLARLAIDSAREATRHGGEP